MRRISTGLIFGVLLTVIAVSLSAQRGGRGPQPLNTKPYEVWTAEQLAKPGSLGNFGHYSASIQRREVGAAPETHTGFSHFLMFTSGEGTFILGGEIVDGAEGKKMIKGGETFKIVIGQMYHIAINTPHQVVPNPGASVTYWVTNINIPKP